MQIKHNYLDIHVYTSGLCEPNQGGIATYGVVAYQGDHQALIIEDQGLSSLGEGSTSDTATLAAIQIALSQLLECGQRGKSVCIHLDDQLCLGQLMIGDIRSINPNLVGLHYQIMDLEREFGEVHYMYVPITLNEAVDYARQAYWEVLHEMDIW